MKRISILVCFLIVSLSCNSQNRFSIRGDKTYLNDQAFQVIGLRCSNALFSDKTTDALIAQLDNYKIYGLNTISVFFMGSRYSNINGYHLDGTIKKEYATRMAKIITECNKRNMVVLIGILYWGAQMGDLHNAFYKDWKQQDAESAMVNTIQWLRENKFYNVFVDPDNEGMAERGMGFDLASMICAGKRVDAEIVIAYNNHGYPPPCADLSIHFGNVTPGMPYIQPEGTPSQYWGDYSKERGLRHYINVGIYTDGKRREQLNMTKEMLDAGHGYMFASTWLQNVPPNYAAGGSGTACDPGIRWWLEFIQKNYSK